MIMLFWIVLNIPFTVLLMWIIINVKIHNTKHFKEQNKRALMNFITWLFAFALFNLAYYQYVVKGAV